MTEKSDGKTCYFTDKTCDSCKQKIATNGKQEWCECKMKDQNFYKECGRQGGKIAAALQAEYERGKKDGAAWLLQELEKSYQGGEYHKEILNKARELCGK